MSSSCEVLFYYQTLIMNSRSKPWLAFILSSCHSFCSVTWSDRSPNMASHLLQIFFHLFFSTAVTTCCMSSSGYKVITFKNPYLGNTCVPFQHWACSHGCATSLEIPAREEQIAAARELDRKYDNYIRDCQRQHYDSSSSSRRRFSLRRTTSRRPSTSSTSYSISVTSVDSLSRCYCPEQSCCASFWCCGRRACKCSQCIS